MKLPRPVRAALLSLALLLPAGCRGLGLGTAVEAAGEVGRELACVVCGEPVPAPPAVGERPTTSEALLLAAWASDVQRRMGEVERAVAEWMAAELRRREEGAAQPPLRPGTVAEPVGLQPHPAGPPAP